MEITDFLFETKKSFLCESSFQILLTNLNSNLKGLRSRSVNIPVFVN